FTVAVGGDADLPLLSELARTGGGQMFALDEAEQTTQRALTLAATIKTPTITDFELDLGAGLDEVFTSANGKVSRGEEVVLLARSHHDIPRSIKVKGAGHSPTSLGVAWDPAERTDPGGGAARVGPVGLFGPAVRRRVGMQPFPIRSGRPCGLQEGGGAGREHGAGPGRGGQGGPRLATAQ
ncbi:MAG: hypothetical protein IPI55_16915, partial [Flavobacteriales bacterium]|nr:hypothetical protein [Flavobacteriales bacterium]